MTDPAHAAAPARSPSPHAAIAPLDAAFDRLAAYGDTLTNGNYAHGPMAAEALDALGLADRIAAFVDHCTRAGGMTRAATGGSAVYPGAWPDRLGDVSAIPGWTALFDTEIAGRGWADTVRAWIGRLAPSAHTAAAHPFIRTGHAVHALERSDTPARRRELARALASFAARFRPAPYAMATLGGTEPLEAVAEAVKPVPEAHRAGPGAITAGLKGAKHAPDFAGIVSRADLSGPAEESGDRIIALFITQFLEMARSAYTAITHGHAVTAASAARTLAPYSAEPQAVLMRALEFGLALRAAFAGLHAEEDPGADEDRGPEALALSAADTLDDHVIKFTEAALAHHARNGSRKARLMSDRAGRLLSGG